MITEKFGLHPVMKAEYLEHRRQQQHKLSKNISTDYSRIYNKRVFTKCDISNKWAREKV